MENLVTQKDLDALMDIMTAFQADIKAFGSRMTAMTDQILNDSKAGRLKSLQAHMGRLNGTQAEAQSQQGSQGTTTQAHAAAADDETGPSPTQGTCSTTQDNSPSQPASSPLNP